MARLPLSQPSAAEMEARKREGTSPPNLQLAVAHAPEVARLQFELNRALFAGMTERQKRLVILTAGSLTNNAYCWGHHVPMAQNAGVSVAQIRGLRVGDFSLFPPDEQLLLTYCTAVVNRNVTDELFAHISAGRTPEEMVKITMLVGYYCMIGVVQPALDVPQDEGFGGFEVPL
jgi:alkylhydroperoxidase family enzyme